MEPAIALLGRMDHNGGLLLIAVELTFHASYS
jgi:hypothetical protein